MQKKKSSGSKSKKQDAHSDEDEIQLSSLKGEASAERVRRAAKGRIDDSSESANESKSEDSQVGSSETATVDSEDEEEEEEEEGDSGEMVYWRVNALRDQEEEKKQSFADMLGNGRKVCSVQYSMQYTVCSIPYIKPLNE